MRELTPNGEVVLDEKGLAAARQVAVALRTDKRHLPSLIAAYLMASRSTEASFLRLVGSAGTVNDGLIAQMRSAPQSGSVVSENSGVISDAPASAEPWPPISAEDLAYLTDTWRRPMSPVGDPTFEQTRRRILAVLTHAQQARTDSNAQARGGTE